MTPTVVLVPVDEFGCGPLPIQLTKFKYVLQEHLGNRANVEIQRSVPAAGPDVHVFRVVHSQEGRLRADSHVHGPNVIEFVSRKYKHCQNDLLVYFEEGTDQLKLFGARSAVARVCRQCGLKDSSTVRVLATLLIGGVVAYAALLLAVELNVVDAIKQHLSENEGLAAKLRELESELHRVETEKNEASSFLSSWLTHWHYYFGD